MASSRSRNGSITSMPDIGIPDHPNRRDTGVGSQSKEIRVRDVSLQVDHYLDDRRNSPASTCSRATRSQVDEESYFTVDEYRCDDPYPQTYDPVPIHPMDRRDIRCRFETPRPVSVIGRGDPPPPPTTSFSSDDWINNRTPPPREASGGFTPNWLMNALPQVKITPFNGDPKEWPTLISSFRDMIHNVRYGQPQVVARSHLMALMNLPSIRDDDSEALAKLNRTLHGAMHALRTGGYEQDLESGMTLEHKKSGSAKPSTKPTPLFGKGPVVFHTSTSPPVKNQHPGHPSESNSSSLKKGVIKKCLYSDNAHSIKTCSTFKDLDVTARVEWVKEKRLCFRCLIGTHRGTECPTEIVCNIGNCGQRHHPLLHGAPRVYPANASRAKNASQPSSKSSDGRAMTIKNRDTAITLPWLSFRQLKCKGNAKHVSFGSFHGQDPQFQSTTVSLTVKARDRSFEADLKQVSTVPTQYLKLPCPPKELMEIRSRYPHLKDVKLVEVGEPTILIGAGNQWLHLRLDERLPPVGTDAPFGILTPFGWTCVCDLTLGTQEHDSTVCRSNKPLLTVQKLCYHVQESPTESLLLRQVEKLWETESFPIVTPAQPLESAEDTLARKKFDETIQFDGTRYEVGLPWVSDDIALPDNYNSALRRLFSIENKFSHNSNFAERYKAVIDDFVAKGFARPFKESELKGNFGRNWYLPHHGVVNPRKPEKVRVVFDASAKYQGVALNEVLLKGPNLINDIGATLLLFREKPVSLSGDIQQMFLQVGVKEEDRSALRFLWRPPGSRKRPRI
ncbi:hypothetical protein GHT06_006730 [Daphnia sinensis]|uniref:Peptidase aspartic putative domain-containing protein n=1 Tax=Daphnia sinensis TaxID=1820382 RepID=A0AAD5KWH6_9CRUS|nr:hypothetical protein GHT06_006730 [Daphnia sinensis]